MTKITRSLLLLAVVFVQFVSISSASSNTGLLSSRSMTEEHYLKKIPPICSELYGPMAIPAAKLIWKNSGPVFAMDAVTRAYGEIWALKGPLTINERSLATVSALVAQGLYPQIKLHLNGFISSGGTLEELYGLVGAAAAESNSKNVGTLADAVFEGLKWREQSLKEFTAPSTEEVLGKIQAARNAGFTLKPQALLLDKLSAQIALGNMEKIREYLKALTRNLPENMNKDSYVDLLITHLIVYCGYPKGMNAFNIWQQLRGELGLK